MSQDTRPLKRIRIADGEEGATSSPSLQDLKRHEELWFDDGNIILIAGGTAFRIYRGLLASQSTVFSDMLVSSSSNAEETLDGCPTVHLSDSPEDLAHFLRVLLPGSRKRFYRRDTDIRFSFDEVLAVIRLAHKYHVEDIQEQALLSLQDFYFTNDYERFVARRIAYGIIDEHVIGVVNLARLTDTPSLLPVAFLTCVALEDTVFDGWTREDGTVEHLSPEDLRRCYVARVALIERSFKSVSAIFSEETSDGCRTQARCVISMRSLYADNVRSDPSFIHNGMIDWVDVISSAAEDSQICQECEKELQARNTRELRKYWEDLPDIFGIMVDGWPSGAEEAGAVVLPVA